MRQDRAEADARAHVPQAASPESSPLSGSSRGVPGSCCLCFCCCCSCSCLSVRGGQDEPSRDNGRQPKSTSSTRETRLEEVDEKTEQPDMEEVNEWGKSFDKMMKSCHGRIIFREFLKTEYSEENMMFWLACEDLKKEKPENQSAIEEKARQIYEDYISILSPKERSSVVPKKECIRQHLKKVEDSTENVCMVSIDSRVREIINRNMVDPTPSTFDEAQQQIYVLMHRDSYPRFLNSKMFKDLLRQVSSEGASS